MKQLASLFLAALVVMGCESTGNVEDPAKTHFIKFYGRDGDQTGRDLEVLPDGSMVLFGTSRPTVAPNGTQFYIVRVDAKGTVIWEKEYGGPMDEEARDIDYTSSGSLVIVGNSYKSAADRDVLVMILSRDDGSMIDSALVPTLDIPTFSVPSSGDEDASTITEVSDGFIIAGSTTYVFNSVPPNIRPATDVTDAMKLRLFTDLTVFPNSWPQIVSGDGAEAYVEIVPAPTGVYGSYYAVGNSDLDGSGNVDHNFMISTLNSLGDPGSDVFFRGTFAEERMSSFVFTGSQLLMVGLQTGTSTDLFVSSAFIPQLDTVPMQFQKNIGINLGANLGGHTAVCVAPVNGGFYLLCEENGFNNNQNWVLTRMNNNGTIGWSAPIVYGGDGFDSAGAVKELADGRVVIIGTMRTGRPDAGEYKMTLVKVDGEGKFEK